MQAYIECRTARLYTVRGEKVWKMLEGEVNPESGRRSANWRESERETICARKTRKSAESKE